MHKKYVIANWKMNLFPKEELSLYQDIHTRILERNTVDVQIGVCPSYLGLALIATSSKFLHSSVLLGSQDVSGLQNGAYTGEIAAQSLRQIGCEFVLIGHSERRTLLGEESAIVKEKALRAKEQNMMFVLCIGEQIHEKNSGLTFSTLSSQIEGVLGESDLFCDASLMIAYEPVWSIGTGEVAQGSYIADVMAHISSYAHTLLGSDIPLLYGGSVDEKSIEILKQQEKINGFLVGSASLDAKKFLHIIECL